MLPQRLKRRSTKDRRKKENALRVLGRPNISKRSAVKRTEAALDDAVQAAARAAIEARSDAPVASACAPSTSSAPVSHASDGNADAHETRAVQSGVDQLRQALLAVVSHELRSPLSGIQSWTHVLAQSLHGAMASPNAAPGLPRAERALAGIVAGVRRQVEMVDGLIDAARVLSGEVTLRYTAFDMRDALNAALQHFQGAIAQRGLQVEQRTTSRAVPPMTLRVTPRATAIADRAADLVAPASAGVLAGQESTSLSATDSVASDAPAFTDVSRDSDDSRDDWQTIIADFDRTVDILRHLVSNAIKFNEAGGTIRLTLTLDSAGTGSGEPDGPSDQLVVSIQNTGMGITSEAMSTIFDSFTQVDQSYSRHREGLGLGLAVASRLAQLQGGQIRAYSEGGKQGATFTLTLPREVYEAAPVKPPSRRAAPAFPSLAGLAIMVVDDQLEARESLAAVLEQSGAEVLPAESGQDAIAQLEARGATHEPDVLICDIAMPGEDGYTTLSRIREWEQNRGVIPGRRLAAIAVTAFAQREDRDRALARGYALHFAKPVDLNRLLGAVAELVAK